MSSTIHHRELDEPVDILLVEDNPGDIRLTQEAFRMAETNTETELHAVNSGTDAIAFLSRSGEYAAVPPPDLVLLDLNLADRDGCRVLETIKTDPQHQHLPVLVLTSSDASEDVNRCYDACANAYLTKPMDPMELVSTVEAIERFWLESVRLPPTA